MSDLVKPAPYTAIKRPDPFMICRRLLEFVSGIKSLKHKALMKINIQSLIGVSIRCGRAGFPTTWSDQEKNTEFSSFSMNFKSWHELMMWSLGKPIHFRCQKFQTLWEEDYQRTNLTHQSVQLEQKSTEFSGGQLWQCHRVPWMGSIPHTSHWRKRTPHARHRRSIFRKDLL